MVEQKRTQLFLMLVQQSGIGSLPLSFMRRSELLNFLRKVEQVSSQERSPIFVYWSSRESNWLLPEARARLLRDAFCVAVFSEDREDKQEEFCFITESQGLCIVLYGYLSEDHNGDVFQCVGSLDPELVRRSFQMMLPVWQFLDLSETNRLEDARMNAGAPNTQPKLVQEVKNMWTAVKAPMPAPNPLRETGEFPFYGAPPPAPQVQPIGGGIAPRPTSTTHDLHAPEGFHDPAFVASESAFVGDAIIAPTERLGPALIARPPAEQDEVAFVRADVATRTKKEKTSKSVRALREVWTTIAEESREIFPPDAQRIIRDITGQLRHSSDHSSILQLAIEELTKVAHADRGLVWQMVGDQLTVTNEFAGTNTKAFQDQKLGSGESQDIISAFLSRFPDETGTGVIAIPDTIKDERLHRTSPTLAGLIELGGVRARVVAQLRCIGRFHGFLELQQSKPREWSEHDASLLQSIAETLSIVVQQSYDLDRREMDANEMKLINTISDMFRESKGQRIKDTLSRSVKLVADHMGFANSQVFLLNEEDRVLLPQISTKEHGVPITLDLADNPFVQVCQTGKARMINVEWTRRADKFFDRDLALVMPLESEGETLGVLGMWKHAEASGRQFRPGDDPKLAQTICNNLASIVRADQAIAQIRADRARERLLNQVNTVIRQSPKDVDQILDALVRALQEHFDLGLCVVSLFDANTNTFIKSKVAGDLDMPPGVEPSQFGEELFQAVL
ncbi:MAG TPA: GAF domain-containing protein, partial [Candidatus Obscuribacterales bacterium]